MRNSVPPLKKPKTTNYGSLTFAGFSCLKPDPPTKTNHTDDCIYPFSVVTEKPIMPPIPGPVKTAHIDNSIALSIMILLILSPVGIALYIEHNNWTLLFLVAIASVYLISNPYLEKLAWRIA